MKFLDSDIFTLAFHRRSGVIERVDAALILQEVAIPILVRAEALRGRCDAIVKASTSDDVLRMELRLAETERYLAHFPIVPFSEVAGQHFKRLSKLKGLKKIGNADLLIASLALAHSATLVTRNTKDFQPIPGLKLENWAE